MRGAPLLLAALAAALALGTGHAMADYRYAYHHAIDAGSAATAPTDVSAPTCLGDPAPCRAIGRSGVAATPTLISLLAAINLAVNAERPAVGIETVAWRVDATDGEPEALAKRRRLIALGLAPSALRLATLATAAGRLHTVLIVRTAAQQLVLDNLTAEILPLADREL